MIERVIVGLLDYVSVGAYIIYRPVHEYKTRVLYCCIMHYRHPNPNPFFIIVHRSRQDVPPKLT